MTEGHTMMAPENMPVEMARQILAYNIALWQTCCHTPMRKRSNKLWLLDTTAFGRVHVTHKQ